MATEAVLLYNCGGAQWAKLRQMLVMLRIRVRTVTAEQYGLPLEALAAGKTDGLTPDPIDEEFSDPMLVFCDIPDPKLEQVLMTMRRAQLPPIALKAVLTPTNRAWNSQQLWTELRREHEAMTAQSQK